MKQAEEHEMPIEYFITEVYPNGGSLVISIPAKHVKFQGLKERDMVKVYLKVVKKNDSSASR